MKGSLRLCAAATAVALAAACGGNDSDYIRILRFGL